MSPAPRARKARLAANHARAEAGVVAPAAHGVERGDDRVDEAGLVVVGEARGCQGAGRFLEPPEPAGHPGGALRLFQRLPRLVGACVGQRAPRRLAHRVDRLVGPGVFPGRHGRRPAPAPGFTTSRAASATAAFAIASSIQSANAETRV